MVPVNRIQRSAICMSDGVEFRVHAPFGAADQPSKTLFYPQARCRAVRLQVGCIDHDRLRRGARSGQSFHHARETLQVIVAHRLVTTSADHRALVPLVDDISRHLGRKPREVSGDAGFASEANLAEMKERKIKACLPPGRARHGEAHAAGRRKLTKMPLMSEWPNPFDAPGGTAATVCANSWSSPSSDRSSRPEDSASSSCAVSIRFGPSGP